MANSSGLAWPLLTYQRRRHVFSLFIGSGSSICRGIPVVDWCRRIRRYHLSRGRLRTFTNHRGSQYLSIRYTERLAEAGVESSVGSVGDSYDNALAESIIGLLKAEIIRRRGPWRHIDAVEYATLEWVDWFNNRQLLEPIGNIPPAELEATYYRQQSESVMVA